MRVYTTIFILFILFSCSKKNITPTYDTSNEKNIYHKEYTNVVKIQGKYTKLNVSTFYLSIDGREEGPYFETDDIFDAIRNHSLRRVVEIIQSDNTKKDSLLYTEDKEYNSFVDDSYNINGVTPLMFAIFYRDLGIINYLLDNGVDLSIGDSDSWNAFFWACAVGNVNILKSLVTKNPDFIHSTNMYGANGLHIAALNDNVDVIYYLVNDLKISINSLDKEGDGVLYYADTEATVDALKKLGATR